MRYIKTDHANLLFRQLAAMTASGMTMVEAITVLAEEGEGSPVSGVVSAIRKEIERGTSPGEAIIKYIPQLRGLSPGVFSQGLGTISQVLRQMAEFSEKRAVLRRFMVLSMVYPAFLITVLFGVLTLLMIVVIPMFSSMYAEIGGVLPLPTRIVMALSRHFWVFGWIIPAGIVAIIVIAQRKRIWLHALADRIPALRTLNRKIAAAEFLRNLSATATMNIAPREAWQHAAAVSNEFYASTLRDHAARADNISHLIDSLGQTGLIPPIVRHAVRAGERSGTIATAFQEIAAYMEQDAEKTYNRYLVFLHPVMIILLGIIVGFCIIALYMPIFQLGSVAS
ncbi:MAG: type II secretion system F family protein [Nitrospirota bacterium]